MSLQNASENSVFPNASVRKQAKYRVAKRSAKNWIGIASEYPAGLFHSNGNLLIEVKKFENSEISLKSNF